MGKQKPLDITISVSKSDATKQPIKEEIKPAKDAIVTASDKHGMAKKTPSIQRDGNIYLLVAIDENGNDKGAEFRVPSKEYFKYYFDESKFRVKKKAI